MIIRFWWVLVPMPGRIWMIQAETELAAHIEAAQMQGRLIREAI